MDKKIFRFAKESRQKFEEGKKGRLNHPPLFRKVSNREKAADFTQAPCTRKLRWLIHDVP